MITSKPQMNLSRREFISRVGSAALVGAAGLPLNVRAKTAGSNLPIGKAKNCIMIWLGGGMGQIDTFDPKRVGVPMENVAGSAYPSVNSNVPGVQVCEHLSNCANIMDRMTVVRTVHHDVVDEHAAAVIRVHTGRPTSGTVQYPSIGSIVSHQLGAVDPLVPAYVVVGYPNVARDPGFLGPKAGYLYITDTEAGPNGLARPLHISEDRQNRRNQLLGNLRVKGEAPAHVKDYDDMLTESLRLAGPDFMGAFDLDRESTDLRESYGSEFGQRCLLARRLVERGVRFVEVAHNLNFINGTGWDVHFQGLANQYLLIRDLDIALSALIRDLEDRGKLDDTLVIVGTEFGRPADFDTGGGRGHYGKCFSLVLAGGGLRHQGAYGRTDDLALEVVENPVTVPDFLATALTAMGIDPAKELFAGKRPVPITDNGRPIQALFG